MNYSTVLARLLATLTPITTDTQRRVLELVAKHGQEFTRLILAFLTHPVTPTATLDFERQLATQLRELGCDLMKSTFNQLQDCNLQDMPQYLDCEGERYRLLAQKNISPSTRSLA